MKILILGASGIIGQHMRLCVPQGVEPVWHRKTEDLLHVGSERDLDSGPSVEKLLLRVKPDAVVNLAGESRPDVVEAASFRTSPNWINAGMPIVLNQICAENRIHYVHVSTQAVLGGANPPYAANDWPTETPANEYGRQKLAAEESIWRGIEGTSVGPWTIVRPTFVLGVRPMPAHGRQNPIEAMLEGQTRQVDNRWFSVSFARDVAEEIWNIATGEPLMRVVHLGVPRQTSRYEVAKMAGVEAIPCKHEDFSGIAPRPIDTTYAGDAVHSGDSLDKAIWNTRLEYLERESIHARQRAKEISIFTGRDYRECFSRLCEGFGPLHQAVAEDFRAANPQTDDELLNWYRTTDSYIWELSAYHCDPGFNYMGMCKGIGERLAQILWVERGTKPKGPRVVCLGDGIGDLTLSLWRQGFDAEYHDLAGSRTAEFAATRFYMYGCPAQNASGGGWDPGWINRGSFDAIVSLDFLEHVTDVPAWAAAIHRALVPGGIFVAQNAFGLGNQEGGSMPMHLNRNDRFVTDWDPLLFSLGFEQLGPQWYRKKA